MNADLLRSHTLNDAAARMADRAKESADFVRRGRQIRASIRLLRWAGKAFARWIFGRPAAGT